MAEGLLRHIAGDKYDVESAGVSPLIVRKEAVEAMREIGVDISEHRSKSVNEFLDQHFDFVITVCDNANETCPVFPGRTVRIHKSFEDPPTIGAASPEKTLNIFRRVRDEIREYLIEFSSAN